MNDVIMFEIFPYVALAFGAVVPMVRYRFQKFKFSSMSSQFLEGKGLFWGSVPWHYGILTVLLGHFLAFLFPKELMAFNRVPVRLLILEVTGLAMALLALLGLILLSIRRLTNKRIIVTTTVSDYLVLIVLLVQVLSGIGIAIGYRWGSNWYAASMVPYLRSLFLLKPNLAYISSMPWIVKLHVFNAFVILTLIPFTRFLHFLVVPLQYIRRPWQIVRWNWDPSKSRKV